VDIWAMGCVFSEMLTWALRDGAAVELYRQARLSNETRLGDLGWREDNFFCKIKGGENDRYDTHIVKPSVEDVSPVSRHLPTTPLLFSLTMTSGSKIWSDDLHPPMSVITRHSSQSS
jgi:hypothetical protein